MYLYVVLMIRNITGWGIVSVTNPTLYTERSFSPIASNDFTLDLSSILSTRGKNTGLVQYNSYEVIISDIETIVYPRIRHKLQQT